MTTTNTATTSSDDYLEVLFCGQYTPEQTAAAAAYTAQHERELAAWKSTQEERARAAEWKAAHRCPRCAGEGRIAQFSHRKGGECFLCGGSGVFAGYKA